MMFIFVSSARAGEIDQSPQPRLTSALRSGDEHKNGVTKCQEEALMEFTEKFGEDSIYKEFFFLGAT